MSHRSSGNSLNVSENMGVVSKTSTPLSGSLENLGGGELLRKNFGGANSTSSQRCVLKRFRSLTDCVVFSPPCLFVSRVETVPDKLNPYL